MSSYPPSMSMHITPNPDPGPSPMTDPIEPVEVPSPTEVPPVAPPPITDPPVSPPLA